MMWNNEILLLLLKERNLEDLKSFVWIKKWWEEGNLEKYILMYNLECNVQLR